MNGRPAVADSPTGSLPVSGFRYILIFGACLLAGNFLLLIPAIERTCVDPWTEANASAAARVATAVGYDAYAYHSVISSRGASLRVKRGCNGAEAFLILAAAVLAFPTRWPRRLVGVLFGAVAVFGFNILRLVNLLMVAVHYPAQLDFFHIYVWQTLIVLLSFGAFLLWGTFIARES